MNNLEQAKKLLWDGSDIDLQTLEQATKTLSSNNINWGDIYFELSQAESFSLEDGIIKGGSFDISKGVGVRAICGAKTGFAYSDIVDKYSLLEACKAAKTIGSGQNCNTVNVNTNSLSKEALYSSENPIFSLKREDKVAILEKIDKQIIKNVRERSIDIQKYEGGEDDMKNEKRKQAIYEYKEKKTTGGVYKITNTESKKSLIKGEVDLQSMQNRFNFSVSVNSCLNIKLQKDWNKYGAKSFTFEILEETEMKPEMDRREFKKYLNEMAEKYTENMDPEELY